MPRVPDLRNCDRCDRVIDEHGRRVLLSMTYADDDGEIAFRELCRPCARLVESLLDDPGAWPDVDPRDWSEPQ